MEDNSNCEANIIQFPGGKTMGGKMAQVICEITLRNE
jgi:hypothetical protein